jgi:hypothetical protein
MQAMTRASLGNGVGGGHSNSYSNADDYAPNSLMSIMLKDPALSTFAQLVKRAQLDFDLGSADGVFTVFCPTSTAISTKLAAEVAVTHPHARRFMCSVRKLNSSPLNASVGMNSAGAHHHRPL